MPTPSSSPPHTIICSIGNSYEPLALRLLGPHLGWLPDWPTILSLLGGSTLLAALAVAVLRSTRWTALSIGESPRAGRIPLLGHAG